MYVFLLFVVFSYELRMSYVHWCTRSEQLQVPGLFCLTNALLQERPWQQQPPRRPSPPPLTPLWRAPTSAVVHFIVPGSFISISEKKSVAKTGGVPCSGRLS